MNADFLAYLIFAFTAIFIFRSAKLSWRRQVLFISNLLFMAAAAFLKESYFLLLVGLLIVDFALLRFLQARPHPRAKPWLIGFIALANTYGLLLFNGMPGTVSLIGLAFAALRFLSILFDIGSGKISEPVGFLDYFNFVVFFPAFLAGPIDRFGHFAAQSAVATPLTAERLYRSLERIVFGLFKTAVAAPLLTYFSIHGIADHSIPWMPPSKVALSLFVYGPWLYLSFSGATDLAIGLGRLLDHDLPENFHQPWAATNLADFWRRWHITLMDWIREYVFFPLTRLFHSWIGGVKAPTVAALLVSFTLVGIWHGSSLNFAWYGLYHGMGLAGLYLLGTRQSGRALPGWRRLMRRVLTWVYISFGWVLYLNKWPLLVQFVKGSG